MSEKSRLSADLKLAKTQVQEAQKKNVDLENKLQSASKTSESLQQKQVLWLTLNVKWQKFLFRVFLIYVVMTE